jgi:aminopeptidase N
MAPYFALTAPQLAFFEPLFGPYPLDRYGLAFSDSFGGLAMETQGRSLFSRDDFPGGTPDYLAHLFTSHELAHQWFGDAVSPADWRDLWLNEAFATYGEWLWLDHVGQDSLEELAEDALEQRQLPTEPTGSPTVDNLFGFERYDGGAVVVHALRAEIGDDAFFTLLQRWVADNDGASRTSEDFMALAAEVSGADLDAFFLLWLYAPSVPADYPT